MIIKLPCFMDVSHWKEIEDFTKVSPRPLLFGTKATEGTNLVDGKFVRFFAGMNQIGVRRLCYHFHRKAYTPSTQAQFFVNAIKPHITELDILALDVEEGGETAAQLRAWCEYVMAALPRNPLWIYSRKNILEAIPTFIANLFPKLADRMSAGHSALDTIQMTLAEREFFRQIPTWIAGYPLNPDLYDRTPSFYVPDQTRWGPTYAWQYSPKGQVAGIQGDVDLNYLDPVAVALLEGPPAPSIPYGYSKIRRYDSDVHIVKVASFVDALVTDTDGRLVTVSEAAKVHRASYAINGDGWYLIGGNAPLSLAASDGDLYQPEQYDFRPFVNISKDGRPAISHYKDALTPWNLVSGTRYLVKAGANVFATATDPEYVTERHPRSAIGHADGGEIILCVVDGRSAASAGVTLRELAEIMILAGAHWALEMDGGGSSALWAEDRIVNVPSDASGERAVVNHLLIFTEGVPSMAKNRVTITWDAGARERLKPRVNTADTYGAVLADNTVHYSDYDIVPDMDSPTDPTKRWIQLQSGWYIAVDYPSSGVPAQRARVELIDPEPSGETIEAVLTEKDSAGAVVATWKGVLTKQ